MGRCSELNCFGMAEAQIATLESELLICKDEFTSNPSSSLERLKQNTLNFAENFPDGLQHFLALRI
jgi:hypothetical protein